MVGYILFTSPPLSLFLRSSLREGNSFFLFYSVSLSTALMFFGFFFYKNPLSKFRKEKKLFLSLPYLSEILKKFSHTGLVLLNRKMALMHNYRWCNGRSDSPTLNPKVVGSIPSGASRIMVVKQGRRIRQKRLLRGKCRNYYFQNFARKTGE